MCGKEFETWPSRVKFGGGKYCSYECSGRSKSITGSDTPVKSIRVCPICEKSFEVYTYQNKKYCSRRCYGISRIGIAKIGTRGDGKFSKHKKICLICSKEFFGFAHTKFCSIKCMGEWNSTHRLGINNPNYSGGHSEYCEKWTRGFKQRIIAFFGDTCIECGIIPLKTLRCHHVYYDKKACCAINEDGKYFSNLNIKGREHNFEIIGDPNKFVPLCEQCHNKTHGKYKREWWARHFEEIVNTQYNGKSYYTKEEYELLQSSPRGL
jgi:hypothetical protein